MLTFVLTDSSYLPCFSTSFRGSTPGERIKNIGVTGPDSSNDVAKSRDLPTTYLLPSFSSTKSLLEEIAEVINVQENTGNVFTKLK